MKDEAWGLDVVGVAGVAPVADIAATWLIVAVTDRLIRFDDEARFDERMRKLVKQKPVPEKGE